MLIRALKTIIAKRHSKLCKTCILKRTLQPILAKLASSICARRFRRTHLRIHVCRWTWFNLHSFQLRGMISGQPHSTIPCVSFAKTTRNSQKQFQPWLKLGKAWGLRRPICLPQRDKKCSKTNWTKSLVRMVIQLGEQLHIDLKTRNTSTVWLTLQAWLSLTPNMPIIEYTPEEWGATRWWTPLTKPPFARPITLSTKQAVHLRRQGTHRGSILMSRKLST
jgi:hypothetical protein